MLQDEKDQLKIRILDLIAKGKEEIELLKEHTKPISPENSLGRISRMDAINNKGVADAAMRNKKRKLSKLQIALLNIEKEGFGVCSDCKRNIQAARLMFLPESTKCVRCAAR